MLHDLLVALYGYPGGVFVLNADGEVKVVNSLPFCHPGEKDVLNRICRLATSYYRLTKFMEVYGGFAISSDFITSDGKNVTLKGTYVRVFCQGIKKALTPYRQSVLKLEQDILQDPKLTVSYVQYSLEQYQVVLPALEHLVDDIVEKQVHGCQILDLIHCHCTSSGLPSVISVMKTIQQSCHKTLFKTLAEWLLSGILYDPFQEFFVVATNSNGHSSFGSEQDCENKINLATATFALKGCMIPCYISVNLAETILFIGESVHRFEHDVSLEKSRHNGYDHDGMSVFNDKKDSFACELYNLQLDEDFSVSKLEAIVDRIRSCVSEHLWTLMVEKSHLVGHLTALKDFYLLGRGDFYTTFIEQASDLLNAPCTTNNQRMLIQAYELCGQIMSTEDDAYFEKFKLKLYPKGKCLYQPRFLSELKLLNAVFKFLFNIRYVQLTLHNCWLLQMETRNYREAAGDLVKWQLRTNMAFIVDNFQYYLQVDVLESQFNILLEKIRATKDFQQVQMAFHTFLTDIIHQTFLLMKPVSQYLQEYLELCLSYCAYLNRSPRSETLEVQTYATEFNRCVMLLLKLLSGIRDHQVSPHISQFLMRVDFNRYFSKSQNLSFPYLKA